MTIDALIQPKEREREKTMRLYKIKTHFYGKDLDQLAMLGYVIAGSALDVFDYIDENYKYSEWPDSVGMTEDEILSESGDFESVYMGVYDQKYGWEDLGEILCSDADILVGLGIAIKVGD